MLRRPPRPTSIDMESRDSRERVNTHAHDVYAPVWSVFARSLTERQQLSQRPVQGELDFTSVVTRCFLIPDFLLQTFPNSRKRHGRNSSHTSSHTKCSEGDRLSLSEPLYLFPVIVLHFLQAAGTGYAIYWSSHVGASWRSTHHRIGL
jgi:hypothetical protein